MPDDDLLSLIRNRRSIRGFAGRPVDRQLIDRIVECGLAAPSSKNSNPWFIVTVAGEDKARLVGWFAEWARAGDAGGRVPIDALTGRPREGIADTVRESVAIVEQCDTLILLFNRGPFSDGADTIIRQLRSGAIDSGQALYGYAGEIIGIGAAAENMLLAARALGLGAVYIADAYPVRRRIQEALGTTRELVGALAVGYAAYDSPPRELHAELAATWSDAVGKIG